MDPNRFQLPKQWKNFFRMGSMGKAGGSRKIYVNVDTLPVGTFSAKYHAHSKQEEYFIILDGDGRLRMGGDERSVSKGDCIAKPCGEENAHQFYNSGTVPLIILDVGTVETGDIGFYPDEGVCLLRDSRLAFRMEHALPGWDSDPNV